MVLAMDVASSEFYSSQDRTYDLNFKHAKSEGSQKIKGDELAALYRSLLDHYPIVSIEDPFDQVVQSEDFLLPVLPLSVSDPP